MSHEQELRRGALTAAADLVSKIKLDPPGTIDDLADITLDVAGRFHFWITTGARQEEHP